jgi:redox-sensing transcriptional repressor
VVLRHTGDGSVGPGMEVPEVVIARLPQYVRALSRLLDGGLEVVSSQILGDQLQMTSAQIRKDLSYFGRFGKQGRGYSVRYLLGELRQILGLDRQWNVAIVGVGRLGRAIISYPGFAPEGFHIVAAFDSQPKLVGQIVGGLMIHPISELCNTINYHNIHIGVVSVPAADAQEVVDRLVECGIKAIFNYAPIFPHIPSDVSVRNIDPVLGLQSMTYHLRTLGFSGVAQGSSLSRE